MPRQPYGTDATAAAAEGQADDEQPFDFERPFLLDIGRAAVIAEALRESGFPDCFADQVAAELAMPAHERSIIGRFAADQLARAGWRP